MPITLRQYADYLDTRDLNWPAPPDFEKPKAKPHLVHLPDIRIVTWSVYGTLLAISEGDLLLEHPNKFIMDLALDKTLQEFKMWGSMTRKPGQPSEYLGQIYRKVWDELKTLPTGGEKCPEIPVEMIWEAIIKKLLQKDYKFDAGFYGSLNDFARKVAYFFHVSLQGVTCYPGAASVLTRLSAAKISQGLISNGQVFTLVQLERSLRKQMPDLSMDGLIDPQLSVFSFQVRGKKPSERLYRTLLQTAQQGGIAPNQILHIGSSVPLDVVPARRLGFRTALFAGDKSSLQVTPEQLKLPGSRPDVLITELDQIATVVFGR